MNSICRKLSCTSRFYVVRFLITGTHCTNNENLEKINKFKEKQKEYMENRVMNIVKSDLKRLSKGNFRLPEEKVPKYSDYVVIGGGIIGSSIAYSMKARAPDSFDVTVIERDPKYTRSSSALSVGGIRQQFSLRENIELSLYSSEFLRNIKQHLSVLDDDPPDICFQPHGYLFLATEAGADNMIKNHRVQKEYGAKVELMSSYQLKNKFPWLNVDGIEMGSYGFENEGWFDPWALLSAFKKKACSLGTKYVNGEVIGFDFINDAPVVGGPPQLCTNSMYIKDEVGEIHCIEFGFLIVAAGPYSGEVAKLLQIGTGPGLLQQPIPVEPRKRYVYVVNCEEGPGIDMPLVIDPTGTYIRREGLGGKYVCGRSPTESEEPDVSNLEVDYNFFDNNVWPELAKRIPAFERLKMSSAWAGYYDYNTFDQNAIFGSHPHLDNVYFATGFSGHGIQMAPAVGRAMMELLIDKSYVTIDMSNLHIHRLYQRKPLLERNIV